MIELIPPSKIQLPPLRPSAPPQLYWLWTTDGPNSPHFPLEGKQHFIGNRDWEPKPLEDFLEAIPAAKDSILILDPHFDVAVGLMGMWEYFSLCQTQIKLKIMLSKVDCLKEIRKWVQTKTTKQSVEVKCTRLQFHDRFAAIDEELWHFGSTVGGAYPQFSAVTRGWSAVEFRVVYDTLWRKASA